MVHKTLLSWLTNASLLSPLPLLIGVQCFHQGIITKRHFCVSVTSVEPDRMSVFDTLSRQIYNQIDQFSLKSIMTPLFRKDRFHTHICMETICVCRDHIRLLESTLETSLQQQYRVFEVSLFGFPQLPHMIHHFSASPFSRFSGSLLMLGDGGPE